VGVPRETEAVAADLFGERLPLALAYASALETSGVERGLIGPREVPRLWERHLLNCVAVAPLIPVGSDLADVGSGAGLPGLVLAIARPDLSVTLVEPLLRRVTWLEEVVTSLGLTNVSLIRARAAAVAESRMFYDVVTARAVAALPTLVEWCLPLVKPGGLFLALKGEGAAAELADTEPLLQSFGAAEWSVVAAGEDMLETPTRVVRVTTGSGRSGSGRSGSGGSGAGGSLVGGSSSGRVGAAPRKGGRAKVGRASASGSGSARAGSPGGGSTRAGGDQTEAGRARTGSAGSMTGARAGVRAGVGTGSGVRGAGGRAAVDPDGNGSSGRASTGRDSSGRKQSGQGSSDRAPASKRATAGSGTSGSRGSGREPSGSEASPADSSGSVGPAEGGVSKSAPRRSRRAARRAQRPSAQDGN
jgi:16S rRNA (guanine527-N7)-methyltransferase